MKKKEEKKRGRIDLGEIIRHFILSAKFSYFSTKNISHTRYFLGKINLFYMEMIFGKNILIINVH